MVFMTGGSISSEVRTFVEAMQERILAKPFDLARLQAVVGARLYPR